MSNKIIETSPVPVAQLVSARWEICPECGVEYDPLASAQIYMGTDEAPHFGNGWVHCSKKCASGGPIQDECDEIFPD